MYSRLLIGATLAGLLCLGESSSQIIGNRRPNIVVIMSDDQDAQIGTLDAQRYVQSEIMGKGVALTNHFATVAQCCPSRTSFLRGQAAHNTNLTHVSAPGGGWDKFVASGYQDEYLPQWLQAAGYRTEYLGKLMNGYNMATYSPKPKGWDHTDILINPYTYMFNDVVMSADGERPIFYDGYHQTDVIRAKALARLEHLMASSDPFYIQIAPAAPHTSGDGPTVPCARHMWSFNDAKAPRTPNFNPADHFQSQKPFWLRDLPFLNKSHTDFVDWSHRSRLQALMGVDELVEDVVELLRTKGALDNTYVVYTTDNGYHEGNHRQMGGKGLPYLEDTHIPMMIRGPGIPAGIKSSVPSTHIDMAPTFLELAGVAKESFPPFLDGRSLVPELLLDDESRREVGVSSAGKEVLNIEFWGTISNGASPDYEVRSPTYAFKTVRIVGEQQAWLYSRWCSSNETELYNTIDDPYELTNLAIDPSPEQQRLMGRLNGLMLVTKSCNQDSCRDPWAALAAIAVASQEKDSDAAVVRKEAARFTNLQEAMDTTHDTFFSSLPAVGFRECADVQLVENEGPYFPPESASLGNEFRLNTDNYVENKAGNVTLIGGNYGRAGSAAHRHVDLATILETARVVTDAEIGTPYECHAPTYPCSGGDA